MINEVLCGKKSICGGGLAPNILFIVYKAESGHSRNSKIERQHCVVQGPLLPVLTWINFNPNTDK